MKPVFSGLLFLVLCNAAIAATGPPRSPVVKIGDVQDAGHGSGFYLGTIDGRDIYVTAAHVLVGVLKQYGGVSRIGFNDGQHSDDNSILVWDNLYDFAILATNSGSAKPEQSLKLDCGPTPAPGTPVYTLGYPLDLPEIRTQGHIASGKVRWQEWQEIVFTDMTIIHGNSGGPVIGPDGEVVGMMVGWLAPSGLTAMIATQRICDWLGLEPETEAAP